MAKFSFNVSPLALLDGRMKLPKNVKVVDIQQHEDTLVCTVEDPLIFDRFNGKHCHIEYRQPYQDEPIIIYYHFDNDLTLIRGRV